MTNKRTNWFKRIGRTLAMAGALAGGSGCSAPVYRSIGEIDAEIVSVQRKLEILEPKDSVDNRLQVRTRVENTRNPNTETNLVKSTLGLGNPEWARWYHYFGEKNGQPLNYDAAAVQIPYKIGEVKSATTLFGTIGDIKGIGVESQHTLENTTLTLNVEKNSTTNSTRIGAGLDQKFGDTTLGIGIDKVTTPKGDTQQYLAKIVQDIDEQNQVGGALVLTKKPTLDEKTIGGFWCHMNDSWGTRTWANYSLEAGVLSLDSIIAQNPTFGKGSSPWIVGRNRGEMYDLGVVEDALGPERVPLGMRVDSNKGGWVVDISGNYSKTGTGNARVEAGYNFPLGNDMNITPSVSYNHGLGDNKMRKPGANVLFTKEFSNGWNLCAEAGVTNYASGKGKNETYVSVGLSFPLGPKSPKDKLTERLHGLQEEREKVLKLKDKEDLRRTLSAGSE